MSAGSYTRLSFDVDKLSSIKRVLLGGCPYAHRISFGFVNRLKEIKNDLGEDYFILDEFEYLEGLRSHSATKREEQFRHPPLHPFWHKHFSTPRHFLRNIGDRWGLGGKGNRDLTSMIEEVARTEGNNVDWPSLLAHKLVVEGYQDRVQRGLTGDWIIYGKHEGKNYYLDVATHQEGKNSQRLYDKLRQGSALEFPFLFS